MLIILWAGDKTQSRVTPVITYHRILEKILLMVTLYLQNFEYVEYAQFN